MPPCFPSTSLCRLHFRKPKAYLNLQSETLCRLGRTISPNALISSFLDLMNSFLFMTMAGISATAASSLPTSPVLQGSNLSNVECQLLTVPIQAESCFPAVVPSSAGVSSHLPAFPPPSALVH